MRQEVVKIWYVIREPLFEERCNGLDQLGTLCYWTRAETTMK
jgi:hypothetical protein